MAWPWISKRSSFLGELELRIDACGEVGAHKAAGVVLVAEDFAGELHEGGFGAVSNELCGCL